MSDVQVEDLRLSLGGNEILKGLSVSMHAGQIVALLGPSGSGKTTLLRAIGGLEEPQSGRIVIGGKPVFDGATGIMTPAEQRNLGLVFQSYALWPHRTVAENVAFPLKLRKVSSADIKSRVANALDQLGLGHLAERYPHQLSGGQQQRVAIARALVYNPPVILLDEPLSNLDAKLREEARIWLKRLIKELGLSAIVVTHDQIEALAMADRLLLLNGGRIEQEGTPEEMYGDPRTLVTAEFMGANNRLDGEIVARTGDRATLRVAGVDLVGHARSDAAPGAKASGLIRIERLKLDGAGEAPNSVVMRLATKSYLGDRWEFLFEREGLLARAYGEAPLPDGDHRVRFPEEALWVF